jgi:molecular chaperone GrpE
MFGKNKKTIKMEDETLKDASENEVNATPEEIKQKEEKVKHEKKRPKSKDDIILDFHQQVKDLNDKYLRLYAEFDNYRKRTIKERIDMTKSAASDMISDLLTVVDDFERANKSFENTSDVDALKEGVQLIYSKFKNILTQKGLEEMKSVGEAFDTDLHEAIANVPAESEDKKDKIIDEVQKGYLLNGKVLRYAKVVVAN